MSADALPDQGESDPHAWCGFGADHDGCCPGMAPCPVCNGTGHGDFVPGASIYPDCDTCGGACQVDEDDARRYRENSARMTEEAGDAR
jgi:hypothetical protein